MGLKIVAVDCGKADTKVCCYSTEDAGVKSMIIPTKLTPSSELMAATGSEDEYRVSINGQGEDTDGEWIIGSLKGQTSYSNSKKDRIHRIITLTAIALCVDNGDTVIASMGCPLTLFDDTDGKNQYFNYILKKGRVDITINGKNHYFYIEKDKCLVFPESFGAVFMYKKSFESNVGVIDIGGLNVNASYFSSGKPDMDLCRTEKLGYYSIISTLRKKINTYCDSSFGDEQIKAFLKQGYVTNRKETSKIIENVLDEHFQKIEKVLIEWDLDSLNLIFIGGTSELLRKQIERRFNKKAYIPDNPNFVNAKGFLKVMLKQLGYSSPF